MNTIDDRVLLVHLRNLSEKVHQLTEQISELTAILRDRLVPCAEKKDDATSSRH